MAEKKEQKRVPGYKSENQKYKSLLVMQYIVKYADDAPLSPSQALKDTCSSMALNQNGT